MGRKSVKSAKDALKSSLSLSSASPPRILCQCGTGVSTPQFARGPSQLHVLACTPISKCKFVPPSSPLSMVRNSNTRSKARLEDADRSRRYPMICANSIGPSADAHRERLHEQSQQRQARYRERCRSADLAPSIIFQSLPTDHVFVFVSSYPVRDCTPYLCTSISLVQKDAYHPHRPCRANKKDSYRPTGHEATHPAMT